MNCVESKLKEVNEATKELFNFNGTNTQLQHLKDLFTNELRNGEINPNYFIDFISHYSICRPNQFRISRELIECVYSCFPEKVNKINKLNPLITYLNLDVFIS